MKGTFTLFWVIFFSGSIGFAQSLKSQAESELKPPERSSNPSPISTYSPATIKVPKTAPPKDDSSNQIHLELEYRPLKLSGPPVIKDSSSFQLDDSSAQSMFSLGGGWSQAFSDESSLILGFGGRLGYAKKLYSNSQLKPTSIEKAGYNFYLLSLGPWVGFEGGGLPESLQLQLKTQWSQAVYIQQASHSRGRVTKDWSLGQVQAGVAWNFFESWRLHAFFNRRFPLERSPLRMQTSGYSVAIEKLW